MMKNTILILSLLLLFALEISRVYYIMPFPGSQKSESIDYAYWIHHHIWWLRLLLLVPAVICIVSVFKHGRNWKKWLLVSVSLIYVIVFYFFNFRFQADKMFYQPGNKVFYNASENKINSRKLVLGVVVNGEAKAYPVQLIGYHHQVRDTVNDLPVMVTYCTVCRTGRVFRPEINGQPEQFRLVGMDHFNAMFEDASTKSWWRQATGVAVAGKLKGQQLAEIPSEQTTLEVWLKKHPRSLILQPDTVYNKQYHSLADFDNGTIKGSLEKRDSLSWQFKSWVIGIDQGGHASAYDWNFLVKERLLMDSIPDLPLLVVLENDTASFHVYNRTTKAGVLQFQKIPGENILRDLHTGSLWDMNGGCVEGTLRGEQLGTIQAYQEFWHSWQTFHPHTKRFGE